MKRILIIFILFSAIAFAQYGGGGIPNTIPGNISFTGKISIGGTYFMSKLSSIGSISDTLGTTGISSLDNTKWWIPLFNITNGDWNTERSTLYGATDTSSFSIFSTRGGKMSLQFNDSVGSPIFKIDTSRAASFYGSPFSIYGYGHNNPSLSVTPGASPTFVFGNKDGSNGMTMITNYNTGGVLFYSTNSNGVFAFRTKSWRGNNNDLYLDTAANLGVRMTPTKRLDVNGTGRFSDTLYCGTTYITANGAGWTQVSDTAYKQNITPVAYDISKFSEVTPIKFQYRADLFEKFDSVGAVSNQEEVDKLASVIHSGFSAQEFNTKITGNPEKKDVSTNELIIALWLKVQELEARIKVLEQQ